MEPVIGYVHLDKEKQVAEHDLQEPTEVAKNAPTRY